MITENCFTDEWIKDFRKQKDHKNVNEIILEKMIYALHLLEQLGENGLDFVFKGGTSLILLLQEDNRFSIDIDIICIEGREKLENILDQIVANSRFTKWDLQGDRSYKPGIPKAHYELTFKSLRPGSGSILLDVLIEDMIYPETINLPIKSKWIQNDGKVEVSLPSIDAITGDKLTAFAPNTIGIPYFKGKFNESRSTEICKQLFDLSKLFEKIKKIETVDKSFRLFAEKEISYRKYKNLESTITFEDVLLDTINTCLIIATRGNGTEKERKNFEELQKGIRAFGGNYLMKGKFRIDEAIPASARIAYLSAKLLKRDLSPIEYYEGHDVRNFKIDGQKWAPLNRLKRQSDKSSFFYWHHTIELLKS